MHLPNCELQYHKRRNSEYSAPQLDCHDKHYFLTQRGAYQAWRNSSGEIWEAFGSSRQVYCPCFTFTQSTVNSTIKIENNSENNVAQDKKYANKNQKQNYDKAKSILTLDDSYQRSGKKKNVSFNVMGTQNKQKQVSVEKNKKIRNKSIQVEQSKFQRSASKPIKEQTPQQQKLQQQKRQKYLKECYSIDKYLKSTKAYTRELPNTAIKLFYQKPCLEPYGRGNTKGNNGFIYNDFMKTHNTLPHRMQNQPKKYQTYRSALNFGKRTKLDPEQRWRRIHRLMMKRLKMNNMSVQDVAEGVIDVDAQQLQQILKLNINTLTGTSIPRSKSLESIHKISNTLGLDQTIKTNKTDFNTTKATDDLKQSQSDRISQLKRSKSWGKKQHMFIYKYTDKDGDVQYCKDRHGITCYVDPTFTQNKQAYTKFLKRINPIEGEDVSPSDRNIDKIRVDNFIKAKQEDAPRHYLIPNCDQPYRPEKYSIKHKKKSINAQALAL